ncbi:MAG: alanine--tRNA ligase [Sporomusaceae bacterium]|nr:alanine--tRNA ligase [Sporomusaceae bacterium]
MMIVTGNELRRKFLDFFKSKEHLILNSYPLIPENDPTLLLIGAGMAPFKPFFTGKMKPPHPRISTCQKCVRTGDIENVGRTARHQTFFEMLGNFSFGDYFKKEAVAWAWEFLTKELGLPADKLWVTIHTEDDEAFEIWTKDISFPAERIVRMEDNFWEIGPGPCGPCSEIYIDLGEERGCGSDTCAVGCDCDRYLEIWNLVFTQYDRDEAGNYTPLAKKNIDTGAGLERIASVLQNKPSNFETDLLFPIIDHVMKISTVKYGESAAHDVSLKVIADHARSMTIMVADGIMPSNEGRGYVLRRILRRAVRHARLLGIHEPFLAKSVDVVMEIFKEAFPDLKEKEQYIKRIIELEEKRFDETLQQGTELLNREIAERKEQGKTVLDGATAFKLYDTFGFPWELTEEILAEEGFTLDKAAFDAAMKEQRERARAARQESEEKVVIPDLSGLVSAALAQDEAAKTSDIVLLFKDGKVVDRVHDGEDAAVILAVTPFYAEGGGQVGDTGFLTVPTGRIAVTNTKKLPDGTVYHLGHVVEGTIEKGQVAELNVDQGKHSACARNHTATHLLQAALRSVLGSHVNQSGSFVSADRLRFDFSHFSPVTPEEITAIEMQVNEAILTDYAVTKVEMPIEEAKKLGATALFGEKYGDQVRVVTVEPISRELCGGSHVDHTAQIGLFRILSEAGIGSGLRRIEAITGQAALDFVNQERKALTEAAQALKTRPEEVNNKLHQLLSHVKELEVELNAAQKKLAGSVVEDLMAGLQRQGEAEIVVHSVVAKDMDELRSMADLVKDRIKAGVVVLGAVNGEKVNFVAMTKGAIKGLHAGNIVKEAAKIAGGGGGGRPDMAQAGGKLPEKIAEALAKANAVIIDQLAKA